jgi:hypothetical protein
MPDRRLFLRRSVRAAGALALPGLPPPLGRGLPADHAAIPGASPAGPDLPLVPNLDPDVLLEQVHRVVAAAHALGVPLEAPRGERTPETVQLVLDDWCLMGVHINPEMRVKVARGPAWPVLVEHRWGAFLVKVRNEAGTTAALRGACARATHHWLELRMVDDPPLSPCLSGLELEYRIMRIHSREAGRREASLAFDVGQGTQDLGFRNEVPILFDCWPASRPGKPPASHTQPGPDR